MSSGYNATVNFDNTHDIIIIMHMDAMNACNAWEFATLSP